MPKAICPYCGGIHRKKSAFNKCKRRNQVLYWNKDGIKVTKKSRK